MRIAINGFGRIGRCVGRLLATDAGSGLELVGINDLTDNETLAHLLSYDSVQRGFEKKVGWDNDHLIIDGNKVRCTAEPAPEKLPWKELGVDVVLECTGRFRDRATASKHLEAGAKRVIISAPGKDIDGTFCVGINTDQLDLEKHKIVSNASCTTNCLAPLVKVLHEKFGIIKGHMITVHSYTSDQRLLDAPHSDMRRARAAAMSMIPTSTGAAKAIGLVIPELAGKLDGSAIRVPTPTVSITCLTAHVKTATTRDAVNQALQAASEGNLRGILGFEPKPLVSSDFIGNPLSSIVDADLTQVVGDDLVEVQSWYDNEWGFSSRMLELAKLLAD